MNSSSPPPLAFTPHQYCCLGNIRVYLLSIVALLTRFVYYLWLLEVMKECLAFNLRLSFFFSSQVYLLFSVAFGQYLKYTQRNSRILKCNWLILKIEQTYTPFWNMNFLNTITQGDLCSRGWLKPLLTKRITIIFDLYFYRNVGKFIKNETF